MFLALAVLLTPVSQVFAGTQLLAVASASMAPTIPVGALVAIRPAPAADLEVGDTITFVNLTTQDVLVTHRVVALTIGDGQTTLTTRGDANDTAEALSVPAGRTIGRVQFAVPYLGFVLVWLGSPLARIALVGLVALGLGLTAIKRTSPPVRSRPGKTTAEPSGDYDLDLTALQPR